MKKLLFITILTLFLLMSARTSFACVDISGFYASFDVERQYLFLGKVVGYSKKTFGIDSDSETYGLKIIVTEDISLPKNTLDYYEVYPNGKCYQKPVKKRWIKKKYPINSLVRLSATEDNSTMLKKKDERIQLKTYFWNISRNDKKKSFISTKTSFFDYSLNKKKYVTFEFEKDLFRLAKEETQLIKFNILKRLAFIPEPRLEYKYLVEHHLNDLELQNYLIELRKKAGFSISHPFFGEPL